MRDLSNPKAALYVRVSTRYQVDGDSLPMQRLELPKYVKYALGIEDYEIFEDAGFSGKNTDRPAYQRMMSRCRTGEFTHIVVWKLDRISRNLLDFAAMYDELKKLGVTFVSKNEAFDTSTAMGEAMLKIILVFAELERNMTSERVTATMVSRAREGLWNGGRVPYGYTLDKKTHELSINQREASVVRSIYNEYERINSIIHVTKWLNGNGIMTRGGKQWSPTTVHKILVSPFYRGEYVYNKKSETRGKSGTKNDPSKLVTIPDHHPAIIERDRQERILSILNDNAKNTPCSKTYERKNIHVFAGLMVCGECGSMMQASIDTRRPVGDWCPSVYLCPRRRSDKGCQNRYASERRFGGFVMNFIANYLRASSSFGRSTTIDTFGKKLTRGPEFESVRITQESISTLYDYLRKTKFGFDDVRQDEANAPGTDAQTQEIGLLRDERGRIERAISRLSSLYLYSDEAISEREYANRNKELITRLNEINTRLDQLEKQLASSRDPSIPYLSQSDLERASYLIIQSEIMSMRHVDYKELVEGVDRRVLKKFINMSLHNICSKDGLVTSITLKSGICVKFIHKIDE